MSHLPYTDYQVTVHIFYRSMILISFYPKTIFLHRQFSIEYIKKHDTKELPLKKTKTKHGIVPLTLKKCSNIFTSYCILMSDKLIDTFRIPFKFSSFSIIIT